MRIIARRTLRQYVDSLAGQGDERAVASTLNAWFAEVRRAHWSTAADVRASYATASVLNSDRVVFNIKGNDYRLVVAVDFQRGIVWIKWIGTHSDYDKISAKDVTYDG